QSNRLNFFANKETLTVGLEEWAITKPLAINLNVHTSTYYVDPDGGNDDNDGKAPSSAWKTLTAVNSRTFGPGAKILFKSGGVWIGQLEPKGSGEENKPIIIDQYGGETKPLINANGALGGVVNLHNQSFWEINNLELTNDAPDMGNRNGVDISASNFGLVRHIHLKNLHIHHVKGVANNGAQTAGIFIRTLADEEKDTRFDDILIEGCEINDVQNQGISFRTPGERDAGFNHPS